MTAENLPAEDNSGQNPGRDLGTGSRFTIACHAEHELILRCARTRLSSEDEQRLRELLWQRIALARALLRKPALLILDEATSALDSENERRIQRAISELHGRMTILVITHRLSTVRDADTIYVLEQGRAVESGSWQGLLAREDGRFQALCLAQAVTA